MSSLSQDTTCQFCFSHEAPTCSPVPFCAPICDICDDRGNILGDDAIGKQRIDILAAMWLGTRTPRHGKGLPAIFTDALIWRAISNFMWDSLVIPAHISMADHIFMAPFAYVIPPPAPVVLGNIRARLETLRRHRRNGRDIQLTLLGPDGLPESSEM